MVDLRFLGFFSANNCIWLLGREVRSILHLYCLIPLYLDANNEYWSVIFHSSPPRVTLHVLYLPVPWHYLSILFHRLICTMPAFKLSFCGWWVGGRDEDSHSFCSIDFWPNLERKERVNSAACFWMQSLPWLSWNEGASASFLLISNSCIACLKSYTFLRWSSRVVSVDLLSHLSRGICPHLVWFSVNINLVQPRSKAAKAQPVACVSCKWDTVRIGIIDF